MKKSIFFMMLFVCNTYIIMSQTIINGGTISGTWTPAGSPYLIQGNVQINNNTTLFIEPGVSVIFQGYYKLSVQGKLLATGTASDTIKFTSSDTIIGWQGIKFINTPDIGMSEIIYCDITYAKGSTYGGAIYFENYSAVKVTNCRIAKCQAGNGGAIGCWNWSDPLITNNLFEYNTANDDGGAIWCMGSSWMKITNNTIINNTANSGGGIFCYVSSPFIQNNIIANNSATLGGGIRANNNSSPVLTNNTIVNNSAENGGGLYSDLTSFPIVRNTILWGNTATTNGQQVSIPDEADPSFYFCNIEGGQAAFYLNGNSYFGNYQNTINSNPLFVAPSSGIGVNYYAGNADWSLQSTSPCIDSGDPNQTYSQTDIAGNIRISVCKIDMGAFEYQKGNPLNISFTYSESFHCTGGINGNISAVISGGGGGPYAYLWSNGDTLSHTPLSNQGIYSVTITDSVSMCSITENDTITYSDFQINAGNDKSIYCANTPVHLDSITSNYTGSQALYYEWIPATGLNFADIPNPVATINTSTTYTVNVTTSNGCTSSAYVNLYLTPFSIYVMNDSVFCGDSLKMSNLTTNYNESGNLTYQWSPSTGLDCDTIAHPTSYINEDTKYYVTVTTPEGCDAIDSIFIKHLQKPLIISSDTSLVCGSSAKLKVSPGWVLTKKFEGEEINSLYFINADTGFAAGQEGLIIKTTDGGINWQILNSNTTKSLNDIFFVNDTLGFAVGGKAGQYGIILKTIDAGSTWTSYTLGTTHILNSVYFINASLGYSIGNFSTSSYIILKTTNGGNSWTTVKTGASANLKDIFFVNSTTGLAVGNNGLILKTSDSGNTWETKTINTTQHLNWVSFPNELTAYISSNTELFKTTDGGNTWNMVPIYGLSGITNMFFVNADTAYICSHNKIFYTENGFSTWIIEELPTIYSFNSIHISSDGTGYAMSFNGITAKKEMPVSYQWTPALNLSTTTENVTYANPNTNTTYTVAITFKNGCVSYDSVEINVQALLISLPLQQTITCGTSTPLIFNYLNQMDTSVTSFSWLPASGLDNPYTANPIAAPINTTDYTVEVTTDNGCSNSASITVNVNPIQIDAGINQDITCGEEVQLNLSTAWTQISSNNFYFRDIYFTSADTGYAVSGGVYITTNGGHSWQMISQQIGHTLQSVFFTNNHTGYAVGNDGIVFKTTDGQSWAMSWIYSTQLKSVFFTHADTGYVVGDAGVIRKTVDGGVNWTIQNSGTTNHLRDVFFTSSDIGFTVGENATYLKTTDGGATWVSQSLIGSLDALNAVYFTDANNGFISGSGGTFLKTTDGGNTWTLIAATWFEGKSIYFSDPLNGYVAGLYGGIAGISKTSDGGDTWSNATYNNLTSLYGMHFPQPNIGYVLGNGMGSYVIMKLPAPPDALSWHPSAGLNDTSISNPIAKPLSTTTYYVSTLTGQCPAIDSVNIFVYPLTVDAGMDVWDTLLVCNGVVIIDSVQTNLSNLTGLSYLWLPSTGLNNDTIPNPIAEVSSSTTYHITVSTANGCIATDSIHINVFPLIVNAGSELFLHCGEEFQIAPVQTNYNGSDTLHYLWTPAAGLSAADIPNPIIGASNTIYTVSISNNHCEATDQLNVSVTSYDAPQICIVNVNTNHNVIVWEKNLLTAVDSFYVYKETNVTGNFIKIAAISYDSLSVFIDTNSQPQAQSSRYKLSFIDSCGLETEMSLHHKTMHLAINQGMGNTWNLIWEPYEGFQINTYNIYRGTHPDSLVLIGTMAGVNTQYSDVNAPAGYVYYQVEILGNFCTPSKSYNYSRSNIATNDPNSIYLNLAEKEYFKFYPNPVEDVFFIEPTIDIMHIIIYNNLGQIVYEKHSHFEKGIVCSFLKPGFYFAKVLTPKGFSGVKFIKK